MQIAPLELLVIQPSPFCNLACDYCYLSDKDNRSRMSPETLQWTIQRAFTSPHAARGFTIVWHAGEPMALPVEFYRKAFVLVDRLNCNRVPIQHSFQTNGTLISEEWCQFIKASNLRIGVSIDGPPEIHDLRRKDRRGRGSAARALKGIDMLRAHGIPFHVISVLTKDSLDRPDEMYRFYVDHQIERIGFNIEESEGSNTHSSLNETGARAGLEHFLRRILTLNSTNPHPLAIREFDGLAAFLLKGNAAVEAGHEVRSGAIINVDWRGNFTTLSPELLGADAPEYSNFVLGNVAETPFEVMDSSPVLKKIMTDVDAGIEKCRAECPYFSVCGGGTPSNKFFENGTLASSVTRHCELTKKTVIEAVLEHLETEVG